MKCFFALFLLLLLAGCASQSASTARDPLEGFNRTMFAASERLDTVLLKPIARGYDAAVPTPVKMSIGNFFDNFRDVSRSGNAFLQGKGREGMSGISRLFINSTVGLFGLFDVASEMGIEKGDEDFGQTLAAWHMPVGPYLYLPMIGPSSGRDLIGSGVDQYAHPLWRYMSAHPAERNALLATSIVHQRAAILPIETQLEEAALDKYAYLRDAYFQRRAAQIRDGRPAPPDDEEDDDDTQP
jgi:phospholipid-binding lipoprotein MlaA